ncbi:hypothetical protein UFVDC4_00212 [Staphylococcus phage vB_SauM-UFV_DC4]|nr:hypothetical protein UFVDC4_00212 [Staphylococcus phage vB_SauM-UFV_DC4]BDE75790.1 hypothetical protein [Staphylococcus phage S6]
MNYFELEYTGLINNNKLDNLVLHKQENEEIESGVLNMVLFKLYLKEFYNDNMDDNDLCKKLKMEIRSIHSYNNSEIYINEDFAEIYDGINPNNNIKSGKINKDYEYLFKFIKDNINEKDLNNIHVIKFTTFEIEKYKPVVIFINSDKLRIKTNKSISRYTSTNEFVFYNISSESLYTLMKNTNRIRNITEKEYKKELVKRSFL